MMGIFAHFRVLSGLPYETESHPHVRICYISCLQNLNNILLKLEFTGILFGTSLYFYDLKSSFLHSEFIFI
jgi:hypothetical protein